MSGTPFTLQYGSQVLYSTDNASWTELSYTIDIDGAADERGEVRLTNNQSPNNGEEIQPGMLKWGETSFEMIYSNALATLWHTMLTTDPNVTQYYFKELYIDTHGCTYPGFLKTAKPSGKTENGAQMYKVVIRRQGIVTPF